jgi:hypothetical protein
MKRRMYRHMCVRNNDFPSQLLLHIPDSSFLDGRALLFRFISKEVAPQGSPRFFQPTRCYLVDVVIFVALQLPNLRAPLQSVAQGYKSELTTAHSAFHTRRSLHTPVDSYFASENGSSSTSSPGWRMKISELRKVFVGCREGKTGGAVALLAVPTRRTQQVRTQY